MQETQVRSLDLEDPLEKGMATHSNILAWKIPQTEEPGGLQSIMSHRVGHDWATNASCIVNRLKIQYYYHVISPLNYLKTISVLIKIPAFVCVCVYVSWQSDFKTYMEMQKPKKRQGISKKKRLEDLHYHFKAIDIKVDWYWGKQRPIELKRNQIIHCPISKGTIAI